MPRLARTLFLVLHLTCVTSSATHDENERIGPIVTHESAVADVTYCEASLHYLQELPKAIETAALRLLGNDGKSQQQQ